MDSQPSPGFRGRGAAENLPNRFENITLERDADWDPQQDPGPATQFFRDATCSLITYNDSPDVGFNASINPYRGCEHGCIYCYARPTHEYLGLSSGLDFETRILVKENAPELLRQELAAPRWRPQVLALSGVTDPYQPIERKLLLTRRCLEILAEFRNPVVIITKNHLVTRDIDVLRTLAAVNAVRVCLSITTLRPELGQVMEPRASLPRHRLAAVRELSAAGISVGVLVAPVIPGLTDHEMPGIISAAADAGAGFAGYVMLRLPFGQKILFENWLQRHFPGQKEKVLNRIRSVRDGKLYDSKFGSRMEGTGPIADQIGQLFAMARRKAGLPDEREGLSIAAFRRINRQQPELFETG
jgi:DNA repair photolyase